MACSEKKGSPEYNKPLSIDLDSIQKRGRLIAVTDFNSTSYFVYKGEPMGFQYELLRSFAEYINVDLEIISENHLDHSFDFLNDGRADILALGLTVNDSRRKEVSLSEPITTTRQVLVQRKPEKWRSLTMDEINRRLIRNQLDLAGQVIYVQEGSVHAKRLMNLAEEIGDTIIIIKVPFNAEALIEGVSRGEIDYAVVDEYIASVNENYYPNIDIITPVSFPQNIAWGVRKENSEKLLEALNTWITGYKTTKSYALLYAKYFRNSHTERIVNSDLYALNSGKISKWDDLIKEASDSLGWDWRLLASLVYQESRFRPDVKSWAGAYGLMQVMPSTGTHFGIDVKSSPQNNVKAGVKYLKWLHTIFDIKVPDPDERIKFILASYNAGPGHVLDAMNLAARYGYDPVIWDNNVELWLQKKSDPIYYNDPVVKSGYFRGTESVKYVSEILDRFDHYKNIVQPVPVSQPKLGMIVKQ